MGFPIIIRNNFGHLSYLILDDQPRELLRHPGFQDEFSMRAWRGSTDPTDAREEWAEMMDEDIDFFLISDSDNWEFCHDLPCWDHCRQ